MCLQGEIEENLTTNISINYFAIWQKTLQKHWWRLTPTQLHLPTAKNQIRPDNKQLSAFTKTMVRPAWSEHFKGHIILVHLGSTNEDGTQQLYTYAPRPVSSLPPQSHSLYVEMKQQIEVSLLLIHNMLTSAEPLAVRTPSSLESFSLGCCATIGGRTSLELSLLWSFLIKLCWSLENTADLNGALGGLCFLQETSSRICGISSSDRKPKSSAAWNFFKNTSMELEESVLKGWQLWGLLQSAWMHIPSSHQRAWQAESWQQAVQHDWREGVPLRSQRWFSLPVLRPTPNWVLPWWHLLSTASKNKEWKHFRVNQKQSTAP